MRCQCAEPGFPGAGHRRSVPARAASPQCQQKEHHPLTPVARLPGDAQSSVILDECLLPALQHALPHTAAAVTSARSTRAH